MALSNEDKVIIDAVKRGDEVAYSKLYEAYSAKLCLYVYSLYPDYKQAEDVVQDALLDLWVKREKLHISTSLNNYLYRMVHNKFINLYKKQTRDRAFLDELYAEAIVELDDTDEDLKEERLKALEEAIENLPPKRKDIFVLSKLKNYKYKEIAEMRGISENTVETQIRKAMIAIREALGIFLTLL